MTGRARAVALIGAFMLSSGCERAPAPTESPTNARALADSVGAASLRGDWKGALVTAQQLAGQEPDLSQAQLTLAGAWHNYGMALQQRTSMERIGCEIQALIATDSAATLARNPAEWSAAKIWRARSLEALGLPLDALAVYLEVVARDPENPIASSRANVLRDQLNHP